MTLSQYLRKTVRVVLDEVFDAMQCQNTAIHELKSRILCQKAYLKPLLAQ
jgi:hypothetical protein